MKVNGSTHALAVLKAELERRAAATRKASNASATKNTQTADAGPTQKSLSDRISDDMNQSEARSLFIGAILEEAVDESVRTSPAFQQMLSRVVAVVERDSEASRLLDDALDELRRS